jgi:HEAT repeat protein
VLKAIDDRDEEVRNWAVHTLDTFAVFSGDARPVEWIAVFRRVLETQRAAGPRAAAAYGLGRYKDHAAEVVPLLVAAGKSRDPEVKTAAILALGWLGPEARAAVPLALEALRDEDLGTRAAAANALGALGDSSDAVIDALAVALADSDRWVVRGAITSLGALGKGSARVAGMLTDYLLRPDADPYACPEAVRMFVFDGTERTALARLSAEFEKSAKAPLSVAYGLCALDAPESARALARLTSALSEGTDPNAVLAYLRMLGPKAAAATPGVVPFLAGEVAQTRMLAAVALGAFGPGAKEAIPALERLAKDSDANVVLGAKQAIEQIRADPAPQK